MQTLTQHKIKVHTHACTKTTVLVVNLSLINIIPSGITARIPEKTQRHPIRHTDLRNRVELWPSDVPQKKAVTGKSFGKNWNSPKTMKVDMLQK